MIKLLETLETIWLGKRLLVLNQNNWNHVIVFKLFVDRNTWKSTCLCEQMSRIIKYELLLKSKTLHEKSIK